MRGRGGGPNQSEQCPPIPPPPPNPRVPLNEIVTVTMRQSLLSGLIDVEHGTGRTL